MVVDDFGVKYVGRENAEHLGSALRDLYKATEDWEGKLYLGITLKWDYGARTVDLSMPGYVQKALKKFCHAPPTRAQHSPHAWTAPTYGAKVQYAEPEDTSTPMLPHEKTRLQEIVGTLLHYGRTIDSTILVALGTIATAQTTGTEATTQAITQLLNYCATHPDATIRYVASEMHLHIHSDASYLSVAKARSRTATYMFLSDEPPDTPPDPEAEPPPMNGAIHIHCAIMKAIISSATEAETGALFYSGKEAAPLRIALEEMGHPQKATTIQTDNACASGITNDTVKQKRSKAMDMRFYWIKDRVEQGQYQVHWRKGTDNLADYFTKHHSPSHHRRMRSRYLLELHEPPKNTKQDICGKGVLMCHSGLPQGDVTTGSTKNMSVSNHRHTNQDANGRAKTCS